jgi:hypothetical protein
MKAAKVVTIILLGGVVVAVIFLLRARGGVVDVAGRDTRRSGRANDSSSSSAASVPRATAATTGPGARTSHDASKTRPAAPAAVAPSATRWRQAQAALRAICSERGFRRNDPRCEETLFAGESRCSEDRDCVAVVDMCGHWIPVNATVAELYRSTRSNVYVGGTPCRWRRPSATPENEPTFKCQDKRCVNHLVNGGVTIEGSPK